MVYGYNINKLIATTAEQGMDIASQYVITKPDGYNDVPLVVYHADRDGSGDVFSL